MVGPAAVPNSMLRRRWRGRADVLIFAPMPVFPRPRSPRVLLADLKAFLSGDQRHKLLFAFLSLLLPTLLIAGFYHDSHVEPPPPEMTFIPSWPATRTDAEIIAQQKIDQIALDKRRAEKQAEFKRLADQLGIK